MLQYIKGDYCACSETNLDQVWNIHEPALTKSSPGYRAGRFSSFQRLPKFPGEFFAREGLGQKATALVEHSVRPDYLTGIARHIDHAQLRSMANQFLG